jgi:Zn-dependent protease
MIFNSPPAVLLSRVITLIIAISVHEFSHAWAADRLGDPGPSRDGRLVLNPLKHLDPMGSVLMLVVGFGWGRPVMVNPFRLRPPIRVSMALVAAAGPFSNLILALLAAIPIRLGLFHAWDIPAVSGLTPSLSEFVSAFIMLNLGLMFFNLIPLAPLDGSKIAYGLLPQEWADALGRLDRYGPMILLLLLASGYFLHFDPLGLLLGPAQAALYMRIVGLPS